MEKNGKLFIFFFLALTFYLIHNTYKNAQSVNEILPEINKTDDLQQYSYLKDPEQITYVNLSDENIVINKNNYAIIIYPKAEYKIYAAVASKYKYTEGWKGEVVPYDIALVWNKLMLPENQKGISYFQGNRWYYYQYEATFPWSKGYIDTHSANNHIIPANKNVLKAIQKVSKKEKIYMEGYLVNLKGTVSGNDVFWNTSLSRNDTGEGACEVFYVKKVVLNNKIYE